MSISFSYSVIFVLLSFFYTTSCGKLFAAHVDDGNAHSLAYELNEKGFDIYGFYDDLIIVSPRQAITLSSEQAMMYIKVYCSFIVELGDISEAENFYVIERQEPLGVKFTEALNVQAYANTLYSSFNRLVVSAKDEHSFPHDLEVLPVPNTPVQLGIRDDLWSVVREVYQQASHKYTAVPNPAITELVEAVDPAALKGFVTYLTGEDPASNILTRNSISQGAKDASLWIQKQFDSFGLSTSLLTFRTDYSPNVLGVKLGATDPTKVVVIGAHYDSRGPSSTSATQRAPGANDNGSGTGAVLHIAKIFYEHNVTFDHTIHFITYSGEEQGLYGSAAYATQLVNEKTVVVGVINADMVSYRVSTEAAQCAFPSRYSTPALETIAREATATYVSQLTIGITTACCSDHQSYYNRGLPATGFFERNGAIADPQYHKSEDLVARTGYDLELQYPLLTKAILATVATVAGVQG